MLALARSRAWRTSSRPSALLQLQNTAHQPPERPSVFTAHPARTLCSFKKFCKDAGLWKDKGNKFNIKPPNRVR